MHVSRAATGFGIQNFGKQWGRTQYFRGYTFQWYDRYFFPKLSLGDTAWLCFCKPSLLQRGKCQICKASQPPIHVPYLLDVKHILIWPAWTERGLSNTARLSVASDYVTLMTTPLHHSRLSRRARTEGHGHPQCAWSASDLGVISLPLEPLPCSREAVLHPRHLVLRLFLIEPKAISLKKCMLT